jgi:hypothetical protein
MITCMIGAFELSLLSLTHTIMTLLTTKIKILLITQVNLPLTT